ncbi:MAG TPA: phenylacetate--CoA ligase family protein [Isosphaeraceae bacterium]|jgi:phenylacetate-coenzyme A ligase PaaK-like adenylate-forming protein|nr:phenylacetate--CoA ligase family protein [Isosphaeraceae bacterium]
MWQVLRLATRTLGEKAVLRKSTEQIRAIQRRRLRDLVRRAKAGSPFYAERLAGIDPDRFELRDIPPVTKAELMADFDRVPTDRRLTRAALEAFMADPARLGEWFLGRYAVSRTSGTQGCPAIIVQDRSMMEVLFALQMGRGSTFEASPWAALERIARPARLAVVTIGRGFYPSAAALAYAPAAYRTFVDRLWLTNIEPLDEVVGRLQLFRPQILLGYASVLELLAREALAGRLTLPALKQVINMSEPLSEGARRLVAEAFGLPVTNNYASGECMALCTGCPSGHGMHQQADWSILEVVDDRNRPVPPGRPGSKVLITNLYNTVQPFLRYELADVVTVSPTPCPCGSPLPLVLKVEGRTDDLLWIRDGDRFRQVHPYVFVDMLDECPDVGWYQIVQVERNRLLLRAAPAPGRRIGADDLQAILRRGLIRFGLGDLIRVDVELARVAPDPSSGKLRRITSRLGPPSLDPAPYVAAAS